MSTENKRVAAYLPQPLYDLLKKFKVENSLSESKAIISILAAHFGVAHEVSQEVAHQFVTVEEFRELQKQVVQLSDLIDRPKRNERSSDSNVSSSHPGQTSIF